MCLYDLYSEGQTKHGHETFKLTLASYRQISNIGRTSVENTIIDHSAVVGASPVGAAPTTFSLWTQHLVSMDSAKTTARGNEKHFSFDNWCALY